MFVFGVRKQMTEIMILSRILIGWGGETQNVSVVALITQRFSNNNLAIAVSLNAFKTPIAFMLNSYLTSYFAV